MIYHTFHEFMDPVIALVTAGVKIDVLGINYQIFQEEEKGAPMLKRRALWQLNQAKLNHKQFF